ncbi:hypothetical protein N7448_007657 [Penicillium atrosanguineum]|uniref:Uncharacterized protein n=1 Tax=Penicillium atrosanguineum TaxID=1132637 RepID=A0A9W9QDB7_9EURO|nr:hypothetical protein N7448_007657 [Penicillium atrosanguineum]KAJ5331605.1 hypothetical protein N7476_001388 [Penicillium atrosanguineum]
MAGLLDLPNEIILFIVDYLQAGIQEAEVQVPFYRLGDAYRDAIDHDQPRMTGYLRSLILLCHRFHDLLTPIMYRDILVRDYNFGGKRRPLDQLNRTLQQNPGLNEFITSASISCGDSLADYSILPLVPFFWYASMYTLTIHTFNDWSPLEFEDDSHVGTSPVEFLRLLGCGAHEEALASTLSWPAVLKSLHYDVEQGEWDGHAEGEPAKEWTTTAFVRALQSQKSTLEELILTRPRCVHEGLYTGPHIILSEFTALKTLQIYHAFLRGWDESFRIWRCLPPNLEVLEVFYDDTDLYRFQNDCEPDGYDSFLPDLIRHKRTRLPHLHTVTIYSPENRYDSESEGEDERTVNVPGLWELPSSLASETEAAGIILNVWLGIDEWSFDSKGLL